MVKKTPIILIIVTVFCFILIGCIRPIYIITRNLVRDYEIKTRQKILVLKKEEITEFLYDKYDKWLEKAGGELSPLPIDILVSFADITSDDIPEMFCGEMNEYGTAEYTAYTLNDPNGIGALGLSFLGSPHEDGDFLCGQRFTRTDGTHYYVNIASWGSFSRSYFTCTEFSYNEDKQAWITITYSPKINTGSDKSTFLATASVYLQSSLFEEEKIEDRIDSCIKSYYSVKE